MTFQIASLLNILHPIDRDQESLALSEQNREAGCEAMSLLF
jgi:hypothetical protein